MDLKAHIREVPDFPKPGILFYDISTLLAHPEAWRTAIDRLSDAVAAFQPDVLVGINRVDFWSPRRSPETRPRLSHGAQKRQIARRHHPLHL